jgi:hypothetical protein
MENTLRELKGTAGGPAANPSDACPMAEQTTAFAFGELGPEDNKKAKAHLTACRYCMALYMDIGMAEEDAKNGRKEKSEVLKRLQAALDRERAPLPSSPWRRFGHAITGLFCRRAS